MGESVLLLVGTPKGSFIVEGGPERDGWDVRGPSCEGWPIHDIAVQPETGALFAGGGSPWYGATVFRSDDRGKTWNQSSEGLTYGEEPKLKTVWNVGFAHGSIYAGVEPAGLFRSDDGGSTWSHVSGLRDHPSRPEWQPGNGGLILHSIVGHPTDPAKMWVGISAVGTFATEDGGKTWDTRNKGVRAGFVPGPAPEFGQCVHKLVMASDRPGRLYQQNHCGVYRSEDEGRTWQEITAGLPSEFGFPMVAHPRDPDTIWTIPLNGAEQGRYVPDGSAAVWRSKDAGSSWVRSGGGLPNENAYIGVLREAMAVDSLRPAGVYFGTSTGQLYGSRDEGDSWSLIAGNLPPVWSVEAAVLPD
ncbi:MAG: exo-alpha-sialidase [Chloroflexi bacterium]|nr:MAG: exo-alpha-sialidase [Chloroflexota bacterium]